MGFRSVSVGYLAAEEEDPGEADGGDAAPDDDGGREQGPVAVDHRHLPWDCPLSLSLLLLRTAGGGSEKKRPEAWICTREKKTLRNCFFIFGEIWGFLVRPDGPGIAIISVKPVQAKI